MKRFTLLTLVAVLLLITAACGGNNNNKTNEPKTGTTEGTTNTPKDEPKKDVTIKMFQFKVEIAEALGKMAEKYKEETGVTVEIETHGGGEDYSALLKAEFAGGGEPEIYNNGGFTGLVPYMDRAVDLSGEAWVSRTVDAAKAPTTVDGKMFGMPMNTEGYGFIYNKDLFAKAGITTEPKTLPELKDAVEKLKAAGITPFMSTNEWWSLGIHFLNVAFANQPDPAQFAEDLKAGKVKIKDNEIFKQWLDLVDLVFDNAQSNLLTTDYATQVANFASGKAAMMQQGNWTQGDIDKVTPNMNLGVLVMPINDQPGHVYIGVPNNWIVNSKSANPDEAKAFLNWMVSSDSGKSFITKDFKFMPAMTDIEATAADIGAAGVGVSEKAGDALGWHWDRFPDGTTQGWGAAMQEYQSKQINRDQLLEALDKVVVDIMSK